MRTTGIALAFRTAKRLQPSLGSVSRNIHRVAPSHLGRDFDDGTPTANFRSRFPCFLRSNADVADLDFDKLVEDYYRPLYRFALSLSRQESEAGDLTQQTFYRWATKGHQLRDASRVKTWLFTTLHREFLGRRRQQDRFVHNPPDEQLSEPLQIAPNVVNALDAEIVQRALQELELRYRAPLTLFYMDQHSYREIAVILEIPIGTVMSRISRGKTELRQKLSDAAARESAKVIPLSKEEGRG